MSPQLHSEGLNLYEQFIEVRKALSEASASFWSDLEIYNRLNRGQTDIVKKSKCLKRTVTITTVNGTQEYGLRDNSFSDITDIVDGGVYFKINGSTYSPLTFKSKKQLAIEYPGWQGTVAGTPSVYYWNKTTKTIGLYPKPNSSNAGAYLFVEGYHLPKVLHAGTASSGSTSTIVLPAGSSTLPYPSTTDDYYNNLYIEIYSGTGAGQKVKITDYVASTRICTATFSTAPDNTSVYGMVPQIPEDAQGLMISYALWKLWPKGGSRVTLGEKYRQEYYAGLSEFIGEFTEDEDEEIVRDSYR
jgi:hypothetical protein